MLLSEPNAPVGPPQRMHRRVSSSVRGSVGHTSPKLRQSCEACALSKVRCPREKPSCSRCESRGVACEYVFTKRPGRKRASISAVNNASSVKSTTSSADSSSSESAINVDGCWSQYGNTTHGWDMYLLHNLRPESTASPKHRDASPVSPSMPTTPGGPDDVPLFTDMEYWSAGIYEMNFAMSAPEFPSGVSIQALARNNAALTGTDTASLAPPVDATGHGFVTPETLSTTNPRTHPAAGSTPKPSNTTHVPWGAASPGAATPSHATNDTSTSSCACLSRALDFLKRLFCSNTPARDATLHAVQAVLQENRHAIEVMESMLDCSECAPDEFFLIVLAMAVLRLLERYGTASQSRRSSCLSSGSKLASSTRSCATKSAKAFPSLVPGTYGTDNKRNDSSDRGRIPAAQLVLSELHRAQRMVNKLSPRLTAPLILERGRNRDSTEKQLGEGGRDRSCSSSVPRTPFSAATLAGIERDVRRSLATLSAGIIESLRQR